MSVTQPSSTVQAPAAAKSGAWPKLLLGLSIGVLGGVIQSQVLSAPMSHGILLGAIFGVAFSLLFARRANTPGAGLIWGLGCALLLWFLMHTSVPLPPGACWTRLRPDFPSLSLTWFAWACR